MSDNAGHPSLIQHPMSPDDHDGSRATPSTARGLLHILNPTNDSPISSSHEERIKHANEVENENDGESEEDEDDDDEDHEEGAEDFVSIGHDDALDFSNLFRRPPARRRTLLDELHPFIQLLTTSNVDDCIRVEEVFPEHERCTREKFEYRLTKCPELSLGLFTLPVRGGGEPRSRPQLIGHIIATRTPAPFVTDESIDFPRDWRTVTPKYSLDSSDNVPGHHEYGRTIAIHSLAVTKEHQGKKVGSTLMRSYIQRIGDALIAERLALLAHGNLVPFYEILGFTNMGPSSATFGGGGWTNMVMELRTDKAI